MTAWPSAEPSRFGQHGPRIGRPCQDGRVIEGSCDPRYEGVRQAFEANFEGGDLGASCAVTVDGALVVDLWGGSSDIAGSYPWQRDTIVNVWSSTKLLTAICVLLLHERKVLSVDAPVAEYWPEFAANGKGGVLVRHVLGHTAGLPVFDEPVDDVALLDWDDCCRRLSAQAPRWTPGDGSGYHAETQGWLLGELIRRVDGRTPGTFLREEVTGPLDLDLHLGLDDAEFSRVADMATLHAVPPASSDSEIALLGRANSIRSAGLVNTASWRRAELPASNAHGNARGMALALAVLANGGHAGGRQFMSDSTIDRAFEVQADGTDRVLGRPIRLGMGFGLTSPATPVGVNDRTLWWAGWGGSMSVVDLENRLTVSYVMNRMLADDDLRAIRVVFAAHKAWAEQ
jgi:CubicO group peptidase (beta-lactamase class C family)